MVYASYLASRRLSYAPIIVHGQLKRVAWASQLSGIHRGLRSEQSRSFDRGSRSDYNFNARDDNRSARPFDRNDRMARKDFKKKKAAEKDDDDDNGRMSRRKRFNDPSSSFGKKSLVYQLKYGPLKETAEKLLAEKQHRQSTTTDGDSPRQTEGQPSSRQREFTGRAPVREPRSSWLSKAGNRRDEAPFDGSKDQARGSRPSFPQRESSRREGFGRRDDAPASNARWADQPRESRSSYPQRGFSRREGFGRRDDAPAEPRSSFPQRGYSRREGFGRRDDAPASNARWADQPRESQSSFPQRGPSRREGFGRGDAAPVENNERDGRPDEPYNKDGEHSEHSEDRPRGPKKQPKFFTLNYTTPSSQFIYGKSVVRAALMATRRKNLYKVYILEGKLRNPTDDPIWSLALQRKVPVEIVSAADKALLDKMSEDKPHNGYAMEASPLPQRPIRLLAEVGDDLADGPGFRVQVRHQTRESKQVNGTKRMIPYKPRDPLQKPLVIFCHEVEDPQNLGAIIRSAKFFGASAVVLTERYSAPISNVVLKASAGAAEEMPILVVDNAVGFLKLSKEEGWHSFAAMPPPGADVNPRRVRSIDRVEAENPLMHHPCILVLANEGSGLPKRIKIKCTNEVYIPGGSASTRLDSLNVSVAGAMLCHAFLKERPDKNAPSSEKSAKATVGQVTQAQVEREAWSEDDMKEDMEEGMEEETEEEMEEESEEETVEKEAEAEAVGKEAEAVEMEAGAVEMEAEAEAVEMEAEAVEQEAEAKVEQEAEAKGEQEAEAKGEEKPLA